MGRKEDIQIPNGIDRDFASFGYAERAVPSDLGVMDNNVVRSLIAAAYRDGADNVLPFRFGVTARWESSVHVTNSVGNVYYYGRYRQTARAITERNRLMARSGAHFQITGAEVQRRAIYTGPLIPLEESLEVFK